MRHVELVTPRGERWRLDRPTSRRERVRGLRGRPSAGPGCAMLFDRCRSIHTFGMSSAITVISLDAAMRVVSVTVMAPRRLLLPRPGVRHIIECSAVPGIRLGDRLVEVAPTGSR